MSNIIDYREKTSFLIALEEEHTYQVKSGKSFVAALSIAIAEILGPCCDQEDWRVELCAQWVKQKIHW